VSLCRLIRAWTALTVVLNAVPAGVHSVQSSAPVRPRTSTSTEVPFGVSADSCALTRFDGLASACSPVIKLPSLPASTRAVLCQAASARVSVPPAAVTLTSSLSTVDTSAVQLFVVAAWAGAPASAVTAPAARTAAVTRPAFLIRIIPGSPLALVHSNVAKD
jgi:hypothetical protein